LSVTAVLVLMATPSMGFSLGGAAVAARHPRAVGGPSFRAAASATKRTALRATAEEDTPASGGSSSLPQKVQVCGFKDCRRVGGGKKLENLVNQVLQDEVGEQGRSGVDVEVCDCLGECGYGPNLVVDGTIVNGVRGRMAVMQALGIAVSAAEEAAKTSENANEKAEGASSPSPATPLSVAVPIPEPMKTASAAKNSAN
jgi:hypothetical protein